MPILASIPKTYIEGFKKISSISNSDFDKIKEGLSYTSLVASLRILATRVVKTTGLNENDLKEIFRSVGSLIPHLDDSFKAEQFVEEVTNLAIEGRLIKDKEPFYERLSFLLNTKQIYYAAKGGLLNLDHTNVYINSKVITDIRSVFDVNVESTPIAGLIIHTLHIHYQNDEEAPHKDIYIAMDGSDIKSLKEALIRAEKKEISLQTVFKKSEMTNLND